jgi:clan AA aspartic protease
MGHVYITGRVSGPDAKDVEVEFLVDSGATISVLPSDVWRRLGLRPIRTERFGLADGTSITRQVSEAFFSLPDGEIHSLVVLGEPGDVALLGVLTLESLGLQLHPLSRKLEPMKLRL